MTWGIFGKTATRLTHRLGVSRPVNFQAAFHEHLPRREVLVLKSALTVTGPREPVVKSSDARLDITQPAENVTLVSSRCEHKWFSIA